MTATVLPFRPSPVPAFVQADVPVSEARPRSVEVSEDFEALRTRGRELVDQGLYAEASVLYRRAADRAEEAGDTGATEEFLCGWGAAETELGNGEAVVRELTKVLDSRIALNRWLAAYTVARARELQGETRKALFHARVCRGVATELERPGLTSVSCNLLGNLHVAEGSESEAAACYRTALRDFDAPLLWRAAAETNLGYCLLADAVRGGRRRRARMRDALTLIYRSVRTFRKAGALQYTVMPHIDLCFAHLELNRPACARRHGQRALELAERYGNATAIRNSLYLLGRTALLESDAETARRSLGELAQRFYPGQAGLVDILMALDLREVVNLRA